MDSVAPIWPNTRWPKTRFTLVVPHGSNIVPSAMYLGPDSCPATWSSFTLMVLVHRTSASTSVSILGRACGKPLSTPPHWGKGSRSRTWTIRFG